MVLQHDRVEQLQGEAKMSGNGDSKPTHLPLANGLIIDTTTGQAMVPSTAPDATIQQQTARHGQSAKSATTNGRDRNNRDIRRGLVDLPADVKAVTTVGAVWLYHMLGISDAEICEALGLRMSQVDMIKGLQLFTQVDNIIKENLATLDHNDVQKRINNMSGNALDKLEDILEDDDAKPATKSRILMNMLDRGGFSARQIMEHRHTLDGSLTIRHIREVAQPKNMPMVDITPESVNGDSS